MSKYVEISFLEVIQPIFMQGTNLGSKINAPQRGARLFKNTETAEIEIFYKGKWSTIGIGNVCSSDYKEVPSDLLGLITPKEPIAEEPVHPRARRGRPPMQAQEVESIYVQPVSMPDFDPNDPFAADAHRAAVRAASANANRAVPIVQNDDLIQAARMQAMGIKHPPTAQVEIPTKPTQGLTGTQGKPKAISHAAMKAQVAKEMKE